MSSADDLPEEKSKSYERFFIILKGYSTMASAGKLYCLKKIVRMWKKKKQQFTQLLQG